MRLSSIHRVRQAQPLQKYERIPNGEPDHFFAETTAKQMTMAVVQKNVDLPMLLEIALALGLKDCDDNMDRLVGLLGNLRNTLPLWELNGWSAVSARLN